MADLPASAETSPVNSAGRGAGPAEDNATPTTGMSCAICLRDVESLQASLVPDCDHAFCLNCLLSWLSQKQV